MTALPLVSAIVTARDLRDRISATLDSALGQDYPPDLLEIVVVDDGSTDGTGEIVAEYAARFPARVHAYHQPYAGPAAATQRALSEARGELLALLPAGADWPSGRITAQVSLLAHRPEVALAYAELLEDDAGATLPRAGDPPRGRAVARLLRHDWIAPSSIVLRAALAAQLGPIPTDIARPDRWIAARAAMLAEIECALVPRPRTRTDERGRGDAPASAGAGGTAAAASERPPGPTVAERIAALREALALQRWFLRNATAEPPFADELGAVWSAFHDTARQLLAACGGDPFATLLSVTDAERADARRALADAHDAIGRGHAPQGAALAARAAGLDPWCAPARQLLAETLTAKPRRVPSDPLAGARRFVTLAFATELIADPGLLAAYGRAFDGNADATLAIDASALTPTAAGEALAELVGTLGLDTDGTAHLIAIVSPIDASVRMQLPLRADALLTREPRTTLATPTFDDSSIAALHTLATHASAA